MMMPYSRLRPVLGSLLFLWACESSTDEPTRPEYEALFDPLPPPTPDVLRGVWSLTQTSDEGQADLRFRFTDGKLVAGAHCTYNIQGATPLTTGQTTTLETDSLDAKTGTFTPGTALAFQTTGQASGIRTTCNGSLTRATYEFEINSTTMTLTPKSAPGAPQMFTKVGD